MSREHAPWPEYNRSYLAAAVGVTRARLAWCCDDGDEPLERWLVEPTAALQSAADAGNEPSALEELASRLQLAPAERELLLLLAGAELDDDVPTLCGRALGLDGPTPPTVGLAERLWSDDGLAALSPGAALRLWHLAHVEPAASWRAASVRLEERALHHLLGHDYLEERLAGLVYPVLHADALVPSQEAVVDELLEQLAWGASGWPALQLHGRARSAQLAVALATTTQLELDLFALSARSLTGSPADLAELVQLWNRESMLTGAALLVEAWDDRGEQDWPVDELVERLDGLVLIASRHKRPAGTRPTLAFEVAMPTPTEQRELWSESLGPAAYGLDHELDGLVSQFGVSARSIVSIGGEMRARQQEGKLPNKAVGAALWQRCRQHTRPQLGSLARALEPTARWDDLVLPDATLALLRSLANRVTHRHQVCDRWGFAARSQRGLGVTALFFGESGTGKTFAAEVLARALGLNLFHIDVSGLVSKYIGETEKNLRRVFDGAEDSGSILLFDEADAIFGRRSDVKDSHDRYANLEVSYLLQRIEAYRGLAILTTNLKDALDQAFVRRLQYIVEFPFPDAAARERIWGAVFPVETPIDQLAPRKLARLPLAGGSIRNIAMGAAFEAAARQGPVTMRDVKEAARAELAKLRRPFDEALAEDWV